jgi:hypothetical protein
VHPWMAARMALVVRRAVVAVLRAECSIVQRIGAYHFLPVLSLSTGQVVNNKKHTYSSCVLCAHYYTSCYYAATHTASPEAAGSEGARTRRGASDDAAVRQPGSSRPQRPFSCLLAAVRSTTACHSCCCCTTCGSAATGFAGVGLFGAIVCPPKKNVNELHLSCLCCGGWSR